MTDPWPDKISWVTNPGTRQSAQIKADTSQFSAAETSLVRNFHRTLPGFQPTPLAKLDNLARQIGVTSIRVKDESHRCGLKAFKILGASFALSIQLAQKLNLSPENLSFTAFQSPELNRRVKALTCITATDGNHGKAVAWALHTSAMHLRQGRGLGRQTAGMPCSHFHAPGHNRRPAGKHSKSGSRCQCD